LPLPKTPSFRLEGRRALVAGASSGIGRACAVALAQAGAKVTLLARQAHNLAILQAELQAEGLNAECLALDICETEALETALDTLEPFDILVNSAGLARHSPALQTSTTDYDAVTNVNVKAAYFLTRAVAKGLMDAQRPGSLINISSQMGHVGGIDRAVYCATKHALEGMTKAMAVEWGPRKIRVNTLCPTFTRTPLAEQTLSIPERRKWIEDQIKLGRIAEVEDLMGAVVFMASDAAAMMTGTSLLIDGGWTAS
jgi:NAD(P)-dependent dehydrogenase (short-subunit alcohol dehydrogenase family)